MTDIPQLDTKKTSELLGALGQQLALHGERYRIAVVGGAALIALGLVSRVTRDVDVVALLEDDGLVSAEPLPVGLLSAVDIVGRDFGLPRGWLNTGPASLFDLGLPAGFLERAERHSYGECLEVLFASRFDQIHFKLYAAVDQGPSRHLADLQALAPDDGELVAAARWSETHDPSEGHREMLTNALRYLGVSYEPRSA